MVSKPLKPLYGNDDLARLPKNMPPEAPPPQYGAPAPDISSPESLSPPRRNPELGLKRNGPLRASSPNHTWAHGAMSPGSKKSNSENPFTLSLPYISPGQLAFSALQFLPVPVLVLDNLKTVVLANEAMGRLLGMVTDTTKPQDISPIIDGLRGQTLPQVGIDMLQDGRPVWVSWDKLFDSLVADGLTKYAETMSEPPSFTGTTPGQSTQTLADPKTSEDGLKAPGNPYLSSTNNASTNSVIEVVVSSKTYKPHAKRKSTDAQVLAKMIINIFEVEENQTYFSLTFTNTETPSTPIPTSNRKIPRSSATSLEAADKKSILNSNPPSVSSSHGSSSPSSRISPGSVLMGSSPFPTMGPPSRSANSSTPSLFHKMTMIKDALLDNTEMPIFALWKDGSAPVMNNAARELFADPSRMYDADREDFDILGGWVLWDEDFTRLLEHDEYPIAVLLRKGEAFGGMRFGIINPVHHKRVIYDVLAEIIKDPATGEMVAGVVTCRDITNMAQEITTIKEQDEERFKLICDTMPQMVWTTTPEGMHDFFNSRWYDYTGLTPEESLGLGWKNPFHPDDMAVTVRRWKHCLATGDPYYTEYRCLSKHGEWRWMLGRAMPLRNKQTGEIEKWFGTCTDVHESMEAKASAKRMRQQLLSVLSHGQTTIFSVDQNRKITMLEGALIWNRFKAGEHHDDDSSDDDLYVLKYVGQNVEEVFNDLNARLQPGEIPAFLKPLHEMIDGKLKRDFTQEHEIGESPGFCVHEQVVVDVILDGRFFRTRFIPNMGKQSRDGMKSESVVDGVIGIIMDVTELKEREIDLKTQVQEKRQLVANEAAAKEASRLKSQFLANVSESIIAYRSTLTKDM